MIDKKKIAIASAVYETNYLNIQNNLIAQTTAFVEACIGSGLDLITSIRLAERIANEVKNANDINCNMEEYYDKEDSE